MASYFYGRKELQLDVNVNSLTALSPEDNDDFLVRFRFDAIRDDPSMSCVLRISPLRSVGITFKAAIILRFPPLLHTNLKLCFFFCTGVHADLHMRWYCCG